MKKILLIFLIISICIIVALFHFKSFSIIPFAIHRLPATQIVGNQSNDNNDPGYSIVDNTYTNTVYGFSLRVSDGASVGSFNDGTGDTILIHQKSVGQAGEYQMQIYITPFDEDIALTSARIKKDIPDIKMENAVEIKTDGTATVAFSSSDTGTRYRQIWFVRNKHLYQILAPADADQITSAIMTSWKWAK